MLFIYPMWDNESQRIGLRRCTPTGYALHAIAELVGFTGLLSFLVMPALLAREWLKGELHGEDLWLLAAPFGIGIASQTLMWISDWCARRKSFHYDYSRQEASWLERGELHTYKSLK